MIMNSGDKPMSRNQANQANQANHENQGSDNVPRLRFPEFAEKLEEKEIVNFAPLQRGFDLPIDKICKGIYPVVFSNGILKYHNEYKAKGPGVVTGRSGTIGNVTYVENDYWPHNTALWVTDFFSNDPKYVYYFYINFDLKRFGTGSGVPTLNRNDIHNQKCLFPQNTEQQKIASFLTTVDDKLQALKKKKTLLEQYKKGVMQKIFSQEIRFRDDNGKEFPKWENRHLFEVLKEHCEKSKGSEEVFSVSVHKGVINQIEHLGRSFAAKSTSHYNLVKPNDIIYTKSPTGDFPYGIIKQSKIKENVIVSPLYGVFTPETEHLGYILDVYFESANNVYNYLASIIQKGAKNTINITNEKFLSKSLFLPISFDEQAKIASFIKSINDKINHCQTQIEKTEMWKKGLLQRMFC